MRRLRLGMVGGGQGAFIGGVHRIASRIDDRWDLVAGALSSTPEKSLESALELGLDPTRSYGDFREMPKAEAARPDGIDAVSIVTPNHMHADPIIVFLEAGIHVICDKPLCSTPSDAEKIKAAVEASDAMFFLTHNYTGYPLIRQARALIAQGGIGEVRVVQAEYAQGWLAKEIEAEGQKQASWRTDPAKSGAGGAIGDIGTHAFNLIEFVTGQQVTALCADLQSFGSGRTLDDNAHIILKMGDVARGMIWASQVAVGCENGLRLRIYGTKGGLEWAQENPNEMVFTQVDAPKQILTRGGPGLPVGSDNWTRIPPGHPEGYLEGFATLYDDIADVIGSGTTDHCVPGIKEGQRGMWFIDAAARSAQQDGIWVASRNA